jgi:hypothetical protein
VIGWLPITLDTAKGWGAWGEFKCDKPGGNPADNPFTPLAEPGKAEKN